MRRIRQAARKWLKSLIQTRVNRAKLISMETQSGGIFNRLEARRVLSVNASFANGLLQIDIDGTSAQTSATLISDGLDFFVDVNGDNLWDPTELRGARADLDSIVVTGISDLGPIGTFSWVGDFLSGPGGIVIDQFVVSNINDVTLNSEAVVASTFSLTTGNSITFGQSSNLVLQGGGEMIALAPNGMIVNHNDASVTVMGTAHMQADHIALGLSANDAISIEQLHIRSTGWAQFELDAATVIVDMDGQISHADRLELTVAGHLELAADSSLQLTGTNPSLLKATGVNSDIRVDGGLFSANSDTILESDDSIFFGESGRISISGSGSVRLETNLNGLMGDSGNTIQMTGGSSIYTSLGIIEVVASGNIANNVAFGNLRSDFSDSTIASISIVSDGGITGTNHPDSQLLAADGLIWLESVNGSIGAGLDDAITLDARWLGFSAGASAYITDIQGGVTVNQVSSAGLSVYLTAMSPLVIEADINVGASSVFTADNNPAAPGDDITIRNNAVVSMIAASSTLTFNAGDHIRFDTGRITTSLGMDNAVILNSNLDGDADGIVGDVAQDPINGTIEVTTDRLEIRSGSGVHLDTNVTELYVENWISGNVLISNQTSLYIDSVLNQAGDVRIEANGAIYDLQDDAVVDITATGGTIYLVAAGEIGALGIDRWLELASDSTLEASSILGGISVRGLGNLNLADVRTTDGLIDIISLDTLRAISVESLTDNALNSISLISVNSDIVVESVLAGPNNSSVTLVAFGDILDGDIGPDDLDIRGHNVSLTALNGSIGSEIDNIFTATPNPLEITSTGTLTADALNGMVALDAANVPGIVLNTPTAWIQSTGNIDVSLFPPAVLAVNNLALVADVDGDNNGTLILPGGVTVPGDLRLQGADISAPGNIGANANRLLFISGQPEILDANVNDLDVLVNGSLRVNAASATRIIDLNLDGYGAFTTGINGHLVINVLVGNLVVDSLVSVQNGNILLQTASPAATITINDDIESTNGAISILSQNSINQNANLLINAGGDPTTHSILVSSEVGSISMASGANTITQGGNIRYSAQGVARDIAVGGLNAGTGIISILAGRDILDAHADTVGVGANGFASQTGNPRLVNLIASEARLEAGRDVGFEGNPLDTSLNTLAVHAGRHVYVLETNALTIGSVGPVSVAQVQLDFGTVNVIDPVLLGARGDNGHVKIEAIGGTMTVGATIFAEQNILLAAGGTDSNLNINADLTSVNGAITALAQNNVVQNANLLVSVGNIADSNSIYVRGIDGSITMASGVSAITQGGNIRYSAESVNRDITIGALNAGNGSISIRAGRDILDGQNDLVGVGADGFATQLGAPRIVNLIATEVRLESERDVGIAGNPLDTSVTTLAVQAGRHIYVYESDALTIGLVGPVSVVQSRLNSTNNAVIDAELSGGRGDTGSVKIETINGSLTIGQSLIAAQNILLAAGGAGGNLSMDASTTSVTGSLSLLAQNDIVQNANLLISAGQNPTDHSIHKRSVNGSITMTDGVSSTTQGGNIRVVTGNDGNIRLGLLDAGNGSVSIIAEGSILDNNGDAINIIARNLRMVADAQVGIDGAIISEFGNSTGGIGIDFDRVDTQVVFLSARSWGGIYIAEHDGIQVDNTGTITVTQVRLNSTNEMISDTAMSDIRTFGNSSIDIVAGVAVNGTLVVTDGAVGSLQANGSTSRDGIGIIAGGNGVVRLATVRTESDIVVNGTIQSNTSVFLYTGRSLFNSNGSHLTSAAAVGQNQIQVAVGENFRVGDLVRFVSNGQYSSDFRVNAVSGNLLTLNNNLLENFAAMTTGLVVANPSVVTEFLFTISGAATHLSHVSVDTLYAIAAADSAAIQGTDWAKLDNAWQIVNERASLSGSEFLKKAFANTALTEATSLEQRFQFSNVYENNYAFYLVNDKSLTIQTLDSGNTDLNGTNGVRPSVYVETRAFPHTPANPLHLSIATRVETVSPLADEGGIILVAGDSFTLNHGARLSTVSSSPDSLQQILRIGNLVDPTAYVNATFFNAGEGALVGDQYRFSTKFVIANDIGNVEDDLSNRHIFQRVASHFGTPGELGFLALVGYADSTLQVFQNRGEEYRLPFVPPVDNLRPMTDFAQSMLVPALFVRETAFTNFFLNQNPILPTEIAVRRADDFFLFSNARSMDISSIQDLTVEYGFIDGVVSLGVPAMAIPLSIQIVGFPILEVFSPLVVLADVPILIPDVVELPSMPSKSFGIEVYLVDYEDTNENGQPDNDELPSNQRVLELLGVSRQDSEEVDPEKPESRKVSKTKISIPKDVLPKSPASITPAELETIRDTIRDSADTKVGIYTIILRKPDGTIEVLDIFPVRDFDPKTESNTDVPLVVPIIPQDAGARLSPSNSSHRENAFATGVLGGLWLLRTRISGSKIPLYDSPDHGNPTDFSSAARKARRGA